MWLSLTPCVIQKYTKIAKFKWLYFPHFTLFCNQISQFYKFSCFESSSIRGKVYSPSLRSNTIRCQVLNAILTTPYGPAVEQKFRKPHEFRGLHARNYYSRTIRMQVQQSINHSLFKHGKIFSIYLHYSKKRNLCDFVFCVQYKRKQNRIKLLWYKEAISFLLIT